MKRIFIKYILGIAFIGFLSINANAQSVTKFDRGLFGEDSEFAIGVHTGIFDSNQSVLFPFNVGVLAQYNYIPDVSRKFYMGAESGLFFTRSKADKLGRTTNLVFGDITVYSGFSFPIKANTGSDDKYTEKVKKRVAAPKIRISPGFVVIFPIYKRSGGSGVNNESIKTSIGFALRMSYHLRSRISIFANISRINRDLDGYAYKGEDTNERSNGNKHDVTYIFKTGVMWKLFK